MSRLGLLILLIAIVLSVAVSFLSHGRMMLIALPLLLGAPLAGLFGRGRR